MADEPLLYSRKGRMRKRFRLECHCRQPARRLHITGRRNKRTELPAKAAAFAMAVKHLVRTWQIPVMEAAFPGNQLLSRARDKKSGWLVPGVFVRGKPIVSSKISIRPLNPVSA